MDGFDDLSELSAMTSQVQRWIAKEDVHSLHTWIEALDEKKLASYFTYWSTILINYANALKPAQYENNLESVQLDDIEMSARDIIQKPTTAMRVRVIIEHMSAGDLESVGRLLGVVRVVHGTSEVMDLAICFVMMIHLAITRDWGVGLMQLQQLVLTQRAYLTEMRKRLRTTNWCTEDLIKAMQILDAVDDRNAGPPPPGDDFIGRG